MSGTGGHADRLTGDASIGELWELVTRGCAARGCIPCQSAVKEWDVFISFDAAHGWVEVRAVNSDVTQASDARD